MIEWLVRMSPLLMLGAFLLAIVAVFCVVFALKVVFWEQHRRTNAPGGFEITLTGEAGPEMQIKRGIEPRDLEKDENG